MYCCVSLCNVEQITKRLSLSLRKDCQNFHPIRPPPTIQRSSGHGPCILFLLPVTARTRLSSAQPWPYPRPNSESSPNTTTSNKVTNNAIGHSGLSKGRDLVRCTVRTANQWCSLQSAVCLDNSALQREIRQLPTAPPELKRLSTAVFCLGGDGDQGGIRDHATVSTLSLCFSRLVQTHACVVWKPVNNSLFFAVYCAQSSRRLRGEILVSTRVVRRYSRQEALSQLLCALQSRILCNGARIHMLQSRALRESRGTTLVRRHVCYYPPSPYYPGRF